MYASSSPFFWTARIPLTFQDATSTLSLPNFPSPRAPWKSPAAVYLGSDLMEPALAVDFAAVGSGLTSTFFSSF